MRNRMILSIVMALFLSCNDINERFELQFSNVQRYGSFVFSNKGTTVINNIDDYNALWDNWNNYDSDGKTPLPQINFYSLMIIVIHYGSGYSGCTSEVDVIESIETDNEKIYITIGELPDLGPCDALVYPLQMVQLKKSSMVVVFKGNIP